MNELLSNCIEINHCTPNLFVEPRKPLENAAIPHFEYLEKQRALSYEIEV